MVHCINISFFNIKILTLIPVYCDIPVSKHTFLRQNAVSVDRTEKLLVIFALLFKSSRLNLTLTKQLCENSLPHNAELNLTVWESLVSVGPTASVRNQRLCPGVDMSTTVVPLQSDTRHVAD